MSQIMNIGVSGHGIALWSDLPTHTHHTVSTLQVDISLVPSPLLCVTLENWGWPGDEATDCSSACCISVRMQTIIRVQIKKMIALLV